jgi:hypothetical protein
LFNAAGLGQDGIVRQVMGRVHRSAPVQQGGRPTGLGGRYAKVAPERFEMRPCLFTRISSDTYICHSNNIMAKRQQYWIYSPGKATNAKPTQAEKDAVEEYFRPLIETFKKKCIVKKPDKRYNYTIDIYTKWHQSNFYLCERYKAEYPDRIADEFERKFARLHYCGDDRFDIAYFRHTGQWQTVELSLSLAGCKALILDNPLFQPMGY